MKELISHALKYAPTQPDKAEDVLQFFCEALKKGDVPDREILEYLAGCFQRIISGDDPSVALGLRLTRGQRRRRTLELIDERDVDLALAVARCMKAGTERTAAFLTVAEKCAASYATVKRAYETFGQTVNALV